jgi:hypothetical protein
MLGVFFARAFLSSLLGRLIYMTSDFGMDFGIYSHGRSAQVESFGVLLSGSGCARIPRA